MAHPTLEYIRGIRASLAVKKAEIVGTNPAIIPGAEHDSKVDETAKKPDPEVKDQTMVPNSGLTTAGAGDDSKITHTNDLTAEQPALTPAKKPEETGDADAPVPGGKTAEALGAEILAGVDAWFAAQKQAETKAAADTQGPSSGEGTAEALITDKGKEPEQLKEVKEPNKKDEVTADAMVPATGEGSSGETAAAAKEAAECCKDGTCGKCAKCKAAASMKDSECCKDGKCGKCAKCKAAASKKDAEGCKAGKCKADNAKKAGAIDMELTSDVLAKIAAVMLATDEGTKLAESVLAKAAGAEAAEKTLNFLRAQSDLAEKQAEYQAGQRDALELILKQAQEEGAANALAAAEAACAGDACKGKADAGDDGITEIADTLDEMVENGEITEDEADQVIVEIANALSGEGDKAPAEEAKTAQAVEAADASAQAPAAGDAAIDNAVAVPPEQFDPNSVPKDDFSDVTPEQVAEAIDSLVDSGEITEDEADQLVQEIVSDGGAGEKDDNVSPEEIATALQEAVESGEIKPEDVQQVLTELEGVPAPDASAAPAAEGAAPAAAPSAEAAPAAAPAVEPKTAGAKLLAAIQAARKAR